MKDSAAGIGGKSAKPALSVKPPASSGFHHLGERP
jgi:hypothetical protein